MTLVDILGFFFINYKVDTIVILKQFLTQVKNMFSTSVETLRTDNDSDS